MMIVREEERRGEFHFLKAIKVDLVEPPIRGAQSPQHHNPSPWA
jgi:hypothetical protein